MDDTRNGLFVEYCAKDFLDGTQMLDPWEELAYRRICDMIYASNDQLKDDDRKLAWATKTGNRWSKIKNSLVTMGKIILLEGRISNARCQKTLRKSALNIAQKAKAGKLSAEARKLLKDNETEATAVPTAVPTTVPTTVPTNQEPKNPSIQGSKGESPIPPSRRKTPRHEARDDPDFQIWYEAFPRHDDPDDAARAYRKAQKLADAQTLLDGARRYAELRKGEDLQFTKQPATWLNKRSWLNESLNPKPDGVSDGEAVKADEAGNTDRVAIVVARFAERAARHRGDDPRTDDGPLLSAALR